VTTEEKWPELKKRLPEDWSVLQTADWFLKDEKLLLVGRKQPHKLTAKDSNPRGHRGTFR
jgi:hypothetical protein